jgi:hypothetical protein
MCSKSMSRGFRDVLFVREFLCRPGQVVLVTRRLPSALPLAKASSFALRPVTENLLQFASSKAAFSEKRRPFQRF